MKIEKRRQFIINFLYFAIILGIVILLARYALGALMPFVIALLVSLLLKPAVAFFQKKLKLPRGFTGVILVVLFYLLLGALLIIIGVQLFAAAKSFFLTLPALYTSSIVPWMNKIFVSLQEFAGHLDPEATAAYNVVSANVTTSLGETVVNISKQVVGWVTSFTLKAPKFLLQLLIMVIATIFLTVDFPRVKAFVMRQFSPRWRDLLHDARVQLGRTLWSYTRSYAMILMVTFGEIALGLTIIGIQNAVGIAVAIAFFDILPVVGSGLILLPWTVFTFISGDLLTGIGLAVLYVVVIVVRQIVEPKIVGDRVGLHPLVTLLSMVLGSYLFGGIGLLGLPITVALLHALNKEGAIHLYKLTDDAPEDAAAADSEKPFSEPLDPPEAQESSAASSPAEAKKATKQKSSASKNVVSK
ncbi:Sodium-lithium/proton antiporter [bioreactor metagenome]|uniref:Sodium-lithium/proton antiporter n=1 Tax=bioreactor metagenome TaxID=1076179 RepID=A0A645BU22_9ZZZZ|nr:sporulation integral membrane protein YtvI [Christensenella sp.]